MTDPNATGIRVEGLNELIRTMKKAGKDLTDLREAHARAGAIVADHARSIAPRRSGRLAGSIRSARQVRLARVQAGSAKVPYAGPIHWGWPSRNIAANPFMSRAAQETESRWRGFYEQAVRDALAQVRGV